MLEFQMWLMLWLLGFAVSTYLDKSGMDMWEQIFVWAATWIFFVLAFFNIVSKAIASYTPLEDCHYFYSERYAKATGYCYGGIEDWKIQYVYLRHTTWAVPDARIIFLSDFAVPSHAVVECESLFDPFAKGDLGELGQWQILPDNTEEMEKLGWKFGNHKDMAEYAKFLWKRSEWKDWRCKP